VKTGDSRSSNREAIAETIVVAIVAAALGVVNERLLPDEILGAVVGSVVGGVVAVATQKKPGNARRESPPGAPVQPMEVRDDP
jgi:hypothetical protein